VKLLEKETELATEREAGEKADAKVHHLEAENGQLREAVQNLVSVQAERDQFADRLAHAEADAQRKAELIDRLNREQGDLRVQLHDKTTALSDANKRIAEQDGHINSLQDAVEQLQAEQDSVVEEMKDDHAREMAQARAEWDASTDAKLQELEDALADKFEREIENLGARVEELTDMNGRLRSDVERAVDEADKASELSQHLLQQLNDAEHLHKTQSGVWHKEKHGIMEELSREQDARAAKEVEFDALMGVKIRLTGEIGEYRRILELEEERHNLPVAKKPAQPLVRRAPTTALARTAPVSSSRVQGARFQPYGSSPRQQPPPSRGYGSESQTYSSGPSSGGKQPNPYMYGTSPRGQHSSPASAPRYERPGASPSAAGYGRAPTQAPTSYGAPPPAAPTSAYGSHMHYQYTSSQAPPNAHAAPGQQRFAYTPVASPVQRARSQPRTSPYNR
jgi:hypothetical protein